MRDCDRVDEVEEVAEETEVERGLRDDGGVGKDVPLGADRSKLIVPMPLMRPPPLLSLFSATSSRSSSTAVDVEARGSIARY